MQNIFKFKQLKINLLTMSILINAILIRELFKYEPEYYRNRFYYRIKQKGWLDEKLDLSELKSDSTMTILTLGQANAANSSNMHYQARRDVLNYYNGSLYKAKEPLIGAGGFGGSVWTILADKLIDSGFCKKVIIIPIAEGGTTVENWAIGDCSQKLQTTLLDLSQHNIKLTHIFWHQGESDNGKSKDNYKKNLSRVVKIIRSHNQNAPFYCSVATYSFLAKNKPIGVDSSIQNAQIEFIKENTNVLGGPNTDELIYAIDRFDSEHFSEYGNIRYANLWFRAVKDHRE
jgi:hypothetical protein